VLTVLPLEHWPRSSLVALLIVVAVCGAEFALKVAAGRRFPLWTLHADVTVATVLISILAAVGVTDHVAFADLYLWIALFAGLYFRPRAVLAHGAAVGAAYAVVLGVGPKVANPAAAWFAIVGTMAVASAVVLGLVSALRSSSLEDPLTGLANRRHWEERFDEEVERSRRSGASLSVAMIDIDGFKAVNDHLGHEAGDRLLQELAHNWQAVVRDGGDFLARLGGDEFSVLAPNSDDLGIRRLTARLVDALPKGVRCSFGAATWDRCESASDLLRRADQAMYQAKLRHRRGEGPGTRGSRLISGVGDQRA
jgi:diguanylate cyclase (GGDEF)-like protein